MFDKFVLVEGIKNAAIYDLDSGKVYSINAVAKDILIKYIRGQSLNHEEKEYIEQLERIGITIDNLSLDKPLSGEIMDKLDDNLQYAWLEITEHCNCNCVHCYGQWGGFNNKKKNLPKNVWTSILDAVLAHGGKSVQLIGGEPLLNPDFVDILRYAHNIGMDRIDVFTNATLMTERIVREIKRCKATVRVSLYGHCSSVHDQVTQSPGSFEKTEQGLKMLKKYDIPTRIAVVVMDINQEYIKDIKSYIESLGFVYNGYDTIRQTVNGTQENHCVSRADILETRYQKEPCFITDKHSFEMAHLVNTCWFQKLAFASNGNIYPCIFARDYVLGNVLEDTVDDIWKRAREPWLLDVNQLDVCCNCEYRYVCRDCRPLAKSLYGENKSRMARCTYHPEEGIWYSVRDDTIELK